MRDYICWLPLLPCPCGLFIFFEDSLVPGIEGAGLVCLKLEEPEDDFDDCCELDPDEPDPNCDPPMPISPCDPPLLPE